MVKSVWEKLSFNELLASEELKEFEELLMKLKEDTVENIDKIKIDELMSQLDYLKSIENIDMFNDLELTELEQKLEQLQSDIRTLTSSQLFEDLETEKAEMLEFVTVLWDTELETEELEQEILENQKIKDKQKEGKWFMWKLRDKDERKENRKENAWRALLTVWLVWFPIALIAKWRKNRKEKKEGTTTPKEKKKGKFWKWLAGGAAIGGWFVVWKNRDSIKEWFENMKKPKNDDTFDNKILSYSNLETDNPDLFEKYENSATAIAKQQDYLYHDELASGWHYWGTQSVEMNIDGEIKTKELHELSGSTLYSFDNTFGNVWEILREKSLEWLIDRHGPAEDFINKIKSRPKDTLSNFLWPYIEDLASYKGLGHKVSDDFAKRIDNWLNSGTASERALELRSFFRSAIICLTYIKDKEVQLEEHLILDKLINDGVEFKWTIYTQESWDELGKVKQAKLLNRIWNNDDWMEYNGISGVINENFLNQEKTVDAIAYVNETIWENKISSLVLEVKIEAINKNRDEIFWLEDNIFNDAEIDIADWSFESTTQDKLKDSCEWLEEIFLNDDGKSFFGAYTSFITGSLWLSREEEDDFMLASWLAGLATDYPRLIWEYKTKIENNTMTKKDFVSFKEFSNDVVALQKELSIATYTMGNINDDSPDHVVAITNNFLQLFNNLYYAITGKWKGMNMSTRERAGYISGGLVVYGGALWLVGKALPNGSLVGNLAKIWGKAAFKVGALPAVLSYKAVIWLAKPIIKNTIKPAIAIRSQVLDIYRLGHRYETRAQTLFKYYIMKWDLTNERQIFKICSEMWLKTKNNTSINKLEDALKWANGWKLKNSNIISKYIKKWNLQELMIIEKRIGNSKFNKIQNKVLKNQLTMSFTINTTNVAEIKKIDNIIKTNRNIAPLFEGALNWLDSKSIGLISILAENPWFVDECKTLLGNDPSKMRDIGRLFAKYSDQFDDTSDMILFIEKNKKIKKSWKLKIIAKNRKKVKIENGKWIAINEIVERLMVSPPKAPIPTTKTPKLNDTVLQKKLIADIDEKILLTEKKIASLTKNTSIQKYLDFNEQLEWLKRTAIILDEDGAKGISILLNADFGIFEHSLLFKKIWTDIGLAEFKSVCTNWWTLKPFIKSVCWPNSPMPKKLGNTFVNAASNFKKIDKLDDFFTVFGKAIAKAT